MKMVRLENSVFLSLFISISFALNVCGQGCWNTVFVMTRLCVAHRLRRSAIFRPRTLPQASLSCPIDVTKKDFCLFGCTGETTVEYDVNTTPFAQQQTSHVTLASEKSTNNSDLGTSDASTKGTLTTQQPMLPTLSTTVYPNHRELCPSRVDCYKLSGDCLDCELNSSCIYGREYNVTCRPKPDLDCIGNQTIVKSFRCRYCYQSEPWEQTCTPTIRHGDCKVNSNPPTMVRVNCSIKDDLICLGQRKFYRRNQCNWTSGYRWSTALTLSVTLGGFGADRFYLGSWRAGLGKLFSFGGLGVWTLVDVVLIAVGYIRPEDGSYYI